MYKLFLDLPLIGEVTVEFQNKNFAEFSCRQLGNYVKEMVGTASAPLDNNIKTRLIFSNSVVVEQMKKYSCMGIGLSKGLRWDNSVLMDGNYEFCAGTSFSVLSKTSTRKIDKIKTLYSKVKNASEEGKYAVLGGEFHLNVLIPILDVYAAVFGLFCVHGSLIQLKNHEVIIVSGLDGVGKSTVSDLLCKDGENKLLADNIVLFDGEKALNFNLAMRLVPGSSTSQKIIYKNKNLIEVLPETDGVGLCKVYCVINLLQGNNEKSIVKFDERDAKHCWIMFMGKAPEIGQANSALSPWLFLFDLSHKANRIDIPVISMAIPNGMLQAGKEAILDELEILGR